MNYLKKTAGKYAISLFEIARENNCIDIVERDLLELLQLIESCGIEYKRVLYNISIKTEVTHSILKNIFDKIKTNIFVQNLLFLLADRRALSILEEVIDSLIVLVLKYKKIQKIEFTTAKSLSDNEKKRINEDISRTLQSDVILEYKIDSKIIGGFIMKLDSKMIDNSIKAKYLQLVCHSNTILKTSFAENY